MVPPEGRQTGAQRIRQEWADWTFTEKDAQPRECQGAIITAARMVRMIRRWALANTAGCDRASPRKTPLILDLLASVRDYTLPREGQLHPNVAHVSSQTTQPKWKKNTAGEHFTKQGVLFSLITWPKANLVQQENSQETHLLDCPHFHVEAHASRRRQKRACFSTLVLHLSKYDLFFYFLISYLTVITYFPKIIPFLKFNSKFEEDKPLF